METLIQELRQFITANFLFGDESGRFTYADEDSFQERGIIDSTGILELVCHLQEKYAIAIADEELIPDNLDSLSKVARFVERKRSALAGSMGLEQLSSRALRAPDKAAAICGSALFISSTGKSRTGLPRLIDGRAARRSRGPA